MCYSCDTLLFFLHHFLEIAYIGVYAISLLVEAPASLSGVDVVDVHQVLHLFVFEALDLTPGQGSLFIACQGIVLRIVGNWLIVTQ